MSFILLVIYYLYKDVKKKAEGEKKVPKGT